MTSTQLNTTCIASWNIQNGLGVDGVLSLERIADTIRAMGDMDVICLQEVSVNMLLPDGSKDDQVAALSGLFTGYTPFFGVALDRLSADGESREQFGNLILSRLPVYSAFYHPLPQPADGPIKQMPRQLTEVTVQTASGPLRVMTTHLEFHSSLQRQAQTARIMNVQTEVSALVADPPFAVADTPYARLERPAACVVCGDFNFLKDSPEYQLLIDGAGADSRFVDAWELAHLDAPHAPTCGIYDAAQWPQGEHCRDFMFVTPDLADSVTGMSVDTVTGASDHQPVCLSLLSDLC